jgi:hypothetical protein
MPTRGLEALAMGCAVAVQEESCLRLFVDDDQGLVPYGPRSGSLAAAMQTILGDWQHHGAAAARGAVRVREQFAMTRVASSYLRFLTFRAAAPRATRRRLDTGDWCQKRVSVSRTWLPPSPAARRRTMQANFRQLGRVLAQHPTAQGLLDMARELLCEFAFYQQRGQAGADEQALFDDAIGLLERCSHHFPSALVPRFVRLRALLHHGTADQRLHALQDAFDLVDRGPDNWQVDPADDVMPFDFHGELFDYRSYLDLVLQAAKGEMVPAPAFARLLLASLAGYVARKTGKPELHERAANWNPAFARYRLDWAGALLARGGDADRELAITLLRDLADGSTEFAAASRLLHALEPDAPVPLALQRIDEQTLDTRLRTTSLFDVERRAPAQARRGEVAGDTRVRPQLAVLVPASGEPRELAALLTDLAGQVNATALELVVALPPAPATHASVLASFAAAFGAVQAVGTAAAASFAERLEACRLAAAAALLTIANAGDRFRPDAFALLLDELRQHPTAVLAFANDGWTPTARAHFDATACVELSCWPTFGRRRLARQNIVGLHAIWRARLHQRYGGFDTGLGAAAEHAFWRRATVSGDVRQLPTLLCVSALDATWHAQRMVPTQATQRLPAAVFAPALREEADSHARLGIVEESVRNDVHQLEQFYGTALLHGDLPTALRMLRAAVEHVPSLLSARLALARLLAATGAPGAREVLAAARNCEPYRERVERLLANADRTKEEPPCLTPPLPR